MNVKKKGRKRRVAGWTLIAFGFIFLWLCSAARARMYRWECFGFGDGAVEIDVGSEVDRAAYVAWLKSLFDGYETVQASEWCWSHPDPVTQPANVHVVRFPVWPLMVAAFGSGGWMVWSTRRRRAGENLAVMGGVMVASGAMVLGLWVWAGWGNARVDFAPAWVRLHHGEATITGPRKPVFVGNTLYLVRAEYRSSSFGTTGKWALWHWEAEFDAPGLWLTVPLWAPGVGLLGVGAALSLFARRASRNAKGRCPCGYDLRGLGVGAVCPECGGKTT